MDISCCRGNSDSIRDLHDEQARRALVTVAVCPCAVRSDHCSARAQRMARASRIERLVRRLPNSSDHEDCGRAANVLQVWFMATEWVASPLLLLPTIVVRKRRLFSFGKSRVCTVGQPIFVQKNADFSDRS